ncbi:MAG TPA: YnbE family lipoprotein [Alphaproteobacteria bacterium]|nr:YnbE family lipoprotein [Alphaproteobacteria bacterium]HOO50295.1 YnbE family lipoprotein [Alphaproteobacteria bacterium]
MRTVLPLLSVCFALILSVSGCTPTVKVEAPDKPIEINMNIKIEQEVRVRVEKDLDEEILDNPELFGLSPQ